MEKDYRLYIIIVVLLIVNTIGFWLFVFKFLYGYIKDHAARLKATEMNLDKIVEHLNMKGLAIVKQVAELLRNKQTTEELTADEMAMLMKAEQTIARIEGMYNTPEQH